MSGQKLMKGDVMKTKKYWFLLVVFASFRTVSGAPVLSQGEKGQTEYIQNLKARIQILQERLRETEKTLMERDRELKERKRQYKERLRQMEEVIEVYQNTLRETTELLQEQINKYKRTVEKNIELRRKLEDEAQNIPAPLGQISPHEYGARRKREANEFLSKGEWQKAVEVYDDIANKYPFTDQGLLALSQKAHVYWAEMEKRTEAASTYRLLAERAAHMIVKLQMRRARAIIDQAIHGPTRGDPAILQEGVEEYRLIVDKFFGEKDAVFKAQTEILGLYRRLGEYEKALQLCKELAALPENQSGSRSAELLSQLAFCYKALERWQDAEKAWLEAIKQHPDSDYYRIMIDVVYRKLGKPEKAEEQYLTIVHRAREEKRKSKAYCYSIQYPNSYPVGNWSMLREAGYAEGMCGSQRQAGGIHWR
jgi:tetratricopeptide (TPR) repeat protein